MERIRRQMSQIIGSYIVLVNVYGDGSDG